jgi:hypothetical protein
MVGKVPSTRSSLSKRTSIRKLIRWGIPRPKAALFGFCLALVAYNMLAVVLAALRSVHGAQIIDQELSLYYVATDVLLSGHMWPTR